MSRQHWCRDTCQNFRAIGYCWTQISTTLYKNQGLYSLKTHHVTGTGIPIINPRQSDDRLRCIMGTPKPVRRRPLINRGPGERFKNTNELLNLRALNFSPAQKMHNFQSMRKIFWVEFQRVPLKFHTKYLTHTLKMHFLYNYEILRALRFKSS